MKHKYNKNISLGYDLSGKRIRKWIHADTLRELNEKIDALKIQQKFTPNTSEVTFGKYAQEWFQAYKSNRSARTVEMYQYALRKCLDLDKIRLKSVTKTACQQVVNAVWKTPKTAKIVRDTMYQIFKAAVADGILIRNPAEDLNLPDQKKKEKHLLTDKELKAIKKADLEPMDRMFVTVLQVFGLRPAEALALQPMDFDLKEKILTVNKAVELRNDNKSSIKSTKTGAVRKIPIPDAVIPKLKAYFKENPGFLLFYKQDKGIRTKSAYRRMTERIMSKINEALGGDENLSLVTGITMYSFRHYRATEWYYLCQKGVISTKKAAEMLGHSEEMFIRVYSHIDEKKEKVAKLYPDLKKVL